MESNYQVFYVYKKSGKRVVVENNITRKEVKKMVQDDIDAGTNTNVKMMCFDTM